MPKKEKKPLPFLENVPIIDAGSEGKAIAKVADLVVFVPFVVPGDVVDIKLFSKKKNFAEGKAVHFHQYSDLRTEAFCSHFGVCGGCKWQNMQYEHQLKYKQKQVFDNFTRIGRFDFPEMQPILASENTIHYRNKLDYAFGSRRWLSDEDIKNNTQNLELRAAGFHPPLFFDRVIDIETCYLQPEPSNRIRLAVKKLAFENNWSFYDSRAHHGFLRNLLIRTSTTGDLMVIAAFGENQEDSIRLLLNYLSEQFPEITSLMYVVNTKKNDTITDLEIQLWKGNPYIIEKMPHPTDNTKELKFKIGPVSFYQTNPVQAFHLYKTTFDFAGFRGDELAYDLYCGTGTISNFVAQSVAKVVGVEYVPEAVEHAYENSHLNGITNTTFYAGDLAKILTADFVAENGKPQIIITDPPRSGMHEKVIKQILEISPEKVVYVSCNPATQARDIALMQEKYQVAAIQPVDMFPHTHHVENVVLLTLKAN